VSQLVLPDDDLDIHPGLVGITQHLDHAPARDPVLIRRAGQLDADRHPVRCPVGPAGLDHDVARHPLVVRDHPHLATADLDHAGDVSRCRLQHADHLPRPPPPMIDPEDSRPDAIPVQEAGGVARAEI
jgi:hypothetical protein